MNRPMTPDYLALAKSISSYAEKYPSPNRKQNIDRLKKLQDLKLSKKKKDKEEYYKLRDQIVLSNGGFAMKYVMRYMTVLNDETSIGELFQEATIGLIESVDTFDLSKKTSFTTYAYFHIKKRIIDFIKHNKLVRAPRDIARNLKHVNEAQCILLSKDGREPESSEIRTELKKSKGIKLTESIIDNIMVLLKLNSAGFEDSFVSEYKDQVSTEEESGLFRNMELNLISSIAHFPERVQRIVCMRYGIARDYSHSPEEVRLMMNPTKEEESLLE